MYLFLRVEAVYRINYDCPPPPGIVYSAVGSPGIEPRMIKNVAKIVILPTPVERIAGTLILPLSGFSATLI